MTVAADTAILLAADAKGQEPTPGKREDLTAGTNVTITLAADGQTARTIVVAGRGTRGTIETIDKDTITINAKGKDGAQKTTVKVNDATTVILGWGKDKGDVQRGTVANLRPGMQVSISLSAADKELARSITVQPPQAENPKNGKQPK